ncbi:MAG TPA: hypothetical protein VFB37_01155 [Steroidobacteraceae bacterium]|nr:hypothetical protein [Steroidobacteraceae bacterium]
MALGKTYAQRLGLLGQQFSLSHSGVKRALRALPQLCTGPLLPMLQALVEGRCASLVIEPAQARELLALLAVQS